MSRLTDADLTRIMRSALPRLGLNIEGYRRVRGTLHKRIARRMSSLGLQTASEYLAQLERDPEEWPRLDAACRMSISRFYRDAEVFESLTHRTLPELAARARSVNQERCAAWSAGCASGEEPYSLALAWLSMPAPRGIELEIIGTDADPHLLARAAQARYPAGSLRELPGSWRERGFEHENGLLRLKADVRRAVSLECQDLRHGAPAGPFDLILCRNSAFTYFDGATQRRVAERIWGRLRRGGVLLIGAKELLPDTSVPWSNVSLGTYAKPE